MGLTVFEQSSCDLRCVAGGSVGGGDDLQNVSGRSFSGLVGWGPEFDDIAWKRHLHPLPLPRGGTSNGNRDQKVKDRLVNARTVSTSKVQLGVGHKVRRSKLVVPRGRVGVQVSVVVGCVPSFAPCPWIAAVNHRVACVDKIVRLDAALLPYCRAAQLSLVLVRRAKERLDEIKVPRATFLSIAAQKLVASRFFGA